MDRGARRAGVVVACRQERGNDGEVKPNATEKGKMEEGNKKMSLLRNVQQVDQCTLSNHPARWRDFERERCQFMADALRGLTISKP